MIYVSTPILHKGRLCIMVSLLYLQSFLKEEVSQKWGASFFVFITLFLINIGALLRGF